MQIRFIGGHVRCELQSVFFQDVLRWIILRVEPKRKGQENSRVIGSGGGIHWVQAR